MFLETKTFQLVTGMWLLIVGVGLGPFMASLLVQFSVAINTAIFGSPAWQEVGFRLGRIFFAAGCAIFAAYGAVLLSLAAAVSAGLVKSPWE